MTSQPDTAVNRFVREHIRQAELYISRAQYHQALEKLHEVRQTDPSNKYILAIIERVQTLIKDSDQTVTQLQHLIERAGADDRDLSVTVGDHGEGVPDGGGEGAGESNEIAARVKRLTMVAMNLFDRGSYEPAFELLFKAYTLDPNSPLVLACEKTFQPALELVRKRGTLAGVSIPSRLPTPDEASLRVSQYLGKTLPDSEPTAPSNPRDAILIESHLAKVTQQVRLESLKRQKEAERKERERAMWREASMPPGLAQHGGEPPSDKGGISTPHAARQLHYGLFPNLRQGKFMG